MKLLVTVEVFADDFVR